MSKAIKIIKQNKQPERLTVKDVKPGERFRFTDYQNDGWYCRLAHLYLCSQPDWNYFYAFSEKTKALDTVKFSDDPVEIDGRSLPEREKVRLRDCQPGDCVELEAEPVSNHYYRLIKSVPKPGQNDDNDKVHYVGGGWDYANKECYKLNIVEIIAE